MHRIFLIFTFIQFFSRICFAEGTAELTQKISISTSRVSGLAVSPVSPDLYVSAKTDGTISLNSWKSRTEIWKVLGFSPLRGHEQKTVISTTSFSMDGKFIAIGRSTQAEVLILRASDGYVMRRLIDKTSPDPGILGTKFSVNNKLLVLSHWRSKSLSVWDVPTGLEILPRLKEGPIAGSISSPTPAFAFAVTADEASVVDVHAYGTRIWERRSGQLKRRLNAPRLDPFSDSGHIFASVLSPDARYSVLLLTTASQDQAQPDSYALVLQNNETGKIENRSPIALSGNQFAWMQADFSSFSISGFVAGTFFVWNARTSTAPTIYKTTTTWLNPDYAWPAGLPFQGFLINGSTYAMSAIDTGIVGLWNLKP